MNFEIESVCLSEVVDPEAFILESIRILLDPIGEEMTETLATGSGST